MWQNGCKPDVVYNFSMKSARKTMWTDLGFGDFYNELAVNNCVLL